MARTGVDEMALCSLNAAQGKYSNAYYVTRGQPAISCLAKTDLRGIHSATIMCNEDGRSGLDQLRQLPGEAAAVVVQNPNS